MHRIPVLTLLMFSLCSSAMAGDADWIWRFGGSYARFGTNASASDAFDTSDVRISQPRSVYIGTYHEKGAEGWAQDTGFYSSDIRSPLALSPGQRKTWTFYLWEDPAWNVVLELMWGWNLSAAPAFHKIEYRLTYVRAAQGIDGGSVPVGTSVVLNQYQQGTWAFPVYKTEDGRTGYVFELTATVIPEPSSLLALGAGGLGLLGAARRRRRRG